MNGYKVYSKISMSWYENKLKAEVIKQIAL